MSDLNFLGRVESALLFAAEASGTGFNGQLEAQAREAAHAVFDELMEPSMDMGLVVRRRSTSRCAARVRRQTFKRPWMLTGQ